MRKFAVLILCCFILTCCKKNIFVPHKVSETFSFFKRSETVYVSPSTTEYLLKATADVGKDGITETIVWPITELSTAVFREHYSHPIFFSEFYPGWLRFDFSQNRETAIKIILFPENIKEELLLVYRNPIYRTSPQNIYIDTIAIRLVPVR